jgi:hypothetical protein
MADLITLAEYKAYNGISSNTQDSEVAALIPKVSRFIRHYINRELTTYFDEPKIEYFDGGDENLILREVPLQEVQSVEFSSDYGNTYTTLVEFTDYVVSKTKDTIECPYQKDGFPYAMNGYRVTYTGGFETVPDDIKLAALDLIIYYITSDMSIKSTRNVGANNTSIEYVTTASLPAHIKRVLDLYRLDLI